MSYARILSRIHNTPLALHHDKLDILTSKVIIPILLSEKVVSDTSVMPENRRVDETTSSGKVQVINVFDSLVAKGGAGDSGFTSYQSIEKQSLKAIDNGATKLVYHIDSPGGEVSGAFELANFIASLPKKYGVETTAITDGMAASAAYVIASSAQKIYATPASILGSMAVIMTRVNMTEADKQNGYEYQILRSKDEKALGNPHEPISSKATEDALKMLEQYDTMMNKTINTNRPSLSIETIVNLKGNTVLASEALHLSLIDGIVSSFSEGLSKVISGTNVRTFNNNLGANMPRTLEEYQAEETRLLGELQTLKATQDQTIQLAVKTEQERILGIMEAGSKFKVPQAAVTKRIKANTSLQDSVSMFEDIAEIAGANPNQQIDAINNSGTVNTQTVNLSEDQQYVANLLAGVDKIKSEQPRVMR